MRSELVLLLTAQVAFATGGNNAGELRDINTLKDDAIVRAVMSEWDVGTTNPCRHDKLYMSECGTWPINQSGLGCMGLCSNSEDDPMLYLPEKHLFDTNDYFFKRRAATFKAEFLSIQSNCSDPLRYVESDRGFGQVVLAMMADFTFSLLNGKTKVLGAPRPDYAVEHGFRAHGTQPDEDGSLVWANSPECDFKDIRCFLEPTDNCSATAAAGARRPEFEVETLDLSQYRASDKYAEPGRVWIAAQVLGLSWQLNAATKARLRLGEFRRKVGLSPVSHGVSRYQWIGVHLRLSAGGGGGAVTAKLGYMRHVRLLQGKYGFTKIYLATDRQNAADECVAQTAIECFVQPTNRSAYAADEESGESGESRENWCVCRQHLTPLGWRPCPVLSLL